MIRTLKLLADTVGIHGISNEQVEVEGEEVQIAPISPIAVTRLV